MSRADAAIVSQKELSELIYIIDDKGKASPLIDEQGSIIHHFRSLRYEMARLYVVEEHEKKVANANRPVKAWMKP